ncbi:MAG: hypothetical protein AAF317_02550, partial [Pseudomonadota bacterium]
MYDDPTAHMTEVFTSASGQPNLPRWFETFFGIIGRIERGALTIVLPDGRGFRVIGAKDGPRGEIRVRNEGFFSRMVRDGELGFAEMYMDGWWQTPDLHQLMDVLLLNNEAIARPFTGAAIVRAYERLRHWLRSNTKSGSKRNISYHYDLGNAFYGHWRGTRNQGQPDWNSVTNVAISARSQIPSPNVPSPLSLISAAAPQPDRKPLTKPPMSARSSTSNGSALSATLQPA